MVSRTNPVEIVRYKGRDIALEIGKKGRQYTWSYRIDDGDAKSCTDRPLSTPALARDEALADAKWTVERMKSR